MLEVSVVGFKCRLFFSHLRNVIELKEKKYFVLIDDDLDFRPTSQTK